MASFTTPLPLPVSRTRIAARSRSPVLLPSVALPPCYLYDTFRGSAGTLLSAHTSDTGAKWVTNGGSYTLDGNGYVYANTNNPSPATSNATLPGSLAFQVFFDCNNLGSVGAGACGVQLARSTSNGYQFLIKSGVSYFTYNGVSQGTSGGAPGTGVIWRIFITVNVVNGSLVFNAQYAAVAIHQLVLSGKLFHFELLGFQSPCRYLVSQHQSDPDDGLPRREYVTSKPGAPGGQAPRRKLQTILRPDLTATIFAVHPLCVSGAALDAGRRQGTAANVSTETLPGTADTIPQHTAHHTAHWQGPGECLQAQALLRGIPARHLPSATEHAGRRSGTAANVSTETLPGPADTVRQQTADNADHRQGPGECLQAQALPRRIPARHPPSPAEHAGRRSGTAANVSTETLPGPADAVRQQTADDADHRQGPGECLQAQALPRRIPARHPPSPAEHAGRRSGTAANVSTEALPGPADAVRQQTADNADHRQGPGECLQAQALSRRIPARHPPSATEHAGRRSGTSANVSTEALPGPADAVRQQTADNADHRQEPRECLQAQAYPAAFSPGMYSPLLSMAVVGKGKATPGRARRDALAPFVCVTAPLLTPGVRVMTRRDRYRWAVSQIPSEFAGRSTFIPTLYLPYEFTSVVIAPGNIDP